MKKDHTQIEKNIFETVSETTVLYGNDSALAKRALYHGICAMEAAKAQGRQFQARIQTPPGTEKSVLARLKQDLWDAGKKAGIRAIPVQSGVNGGLKAPEVILTAAGLREKNSKDPHEAEGEAVIMTGWAGMEGMLAVLAEKREALALHFAPAFLRQIEKYEIYMREIPDMEAIREAGAHETVHVGEGGILGALWRLAQNSGCAMDIDMKQIPILQETIEVCEYFRLNPYQLTSAGCFLFMAGDGKRAVNMLEEKEIPARIIGRITEGNDKILRNGGEIRYLDRPAPDEILKILD